MFKEKLIWYSCEENKIYLSEFFWNGKKVQENSFYIENIEYNVFVNNHLCSTPSMASVIILGRNSNGYSEWKNKEGIKLKDLIN